MSSNYNKGYNTVIIKVYYVAYQTAYGATDIMEYVFERYFTNTIEVEVTDRLYEAFLLAMIKETPRVISNSNNYEARANIMWTGTAMQLNKKVKRMNMNLSNMKVGLVLAGGGAKGAYEVGVYKALRELDIVENIKVISGTSIGSINALFFAMDDPKVIKGSWNSLNYSDFLLNQESTRLSSISSLLEKIRSINSESSLFEQIRLSDIGLLSQSGIRKFIEKNIDISIIENCSKKLYANAYNVDKERPEYFKLNGCSKDEIIDRVLASCAVPHMFKPIIIEGTRYADGGIHSPLYSKSNVDNVPIFPLKGYNLDMIIVVHLSYKNSIDRGGFEDTKIVEIYPSSPLEIFTGMGTININKNNINHNMELGYRDAMVILAPMIINILKGIEIDELIERNNERNKMNLGG